jgi:dimethylaniline monooxygenase (N-oxide forming)
VENRTGQRTGVLSGGRPARYAVIGAGASGLCCAKYLVQSGFEDVTIFEIGTQIGGMWCYENDSGLSSAYRTLHINTARNLTNFSDFKFAEDVQMFPDHWDMHRYLVAYAEHFDLTRRIRFKSRVANLRPAAGYRREAPRWEIELADGTVETFDRVIVATGHLSKPMHVPELKEGFKGDYLHSHYYREPGPYVGKRICVVGVGNSACDIASDVCVTSPQTVMVARSDLSSSSR